MNNPKPSVVLRIRVASILVLLVTAVTGCAYNGEATTVVAAQNRELVQPIATIERPVIGGISQGIVLKGANPDNPILLYVHGGPGRPAYPALHNNDQWQQLERLFTIAYWDQRGTGMSNPPGLDVSTINLDQLVDDTAEVVRFLKGKFGKEKVYLLGHSWGSMLGSVAVQRYPELFHAYIGVGQVGNQVDSERETLAWLNMVAAHQQDNKSLAKLSKLRLPQGLDAKEWFDYLVVNRSLVSKYKGAWYTNSFSNEDYSRVMATLPHYTELEHKNNIAVYITSLLQMWPIFVAKDLNITVPEQAVPVYIFQGTNDYQTTYHQAQIYFDNLRASTKKFYTFKGAAHWPHVEQYDDFERIVKRDILKVSD